MIYTVVLVLLFCSAALLTWALLPDASSRTIRRRIFSEVSAEKRTTWLEQLSNLLAPINQRLPLGGYSSRTRQLLDTAVLRMHPLHFFVLQEVCAVAGAVIYFVIFGHSFNAVWLAVFCLIGFTVPRFWVNNRNQKRRMAISKDLPSVVDLLNLSVSAGSDFMTALGRIVREFRPCPVREELGIVLQEIRMGKRRRDALRGFADRLKTPEAQTFARTLIQVDRMGKGLTEALQVLAEDMHLARFHWAERFAQQAPVKMLLPLIFSLGAAMIVVAGPVLMQFLEGGFNGPGNLQGH